MRIKVYLAAVSRHSLAVSISQIAIFLSLSKDLIALEGIKGPEHLNQCILVAFLAEMREQSKPQFKVGKT